ncbi:MAG TPA: hypothetical protein VG797_01350 [Phycisphaerales bacterium]|nr:hypothetical protein [Phycisphaerales bacterium]
MQPLTLPGKKMFGAAVAMAAVSATIGTAFVWIIKPAVWTAPGMAALPVVGGMGLALLLIRPGQARTPAQWVPVLFLGQGVSLFGVLILAVLLYFSARPDPLAFAMVAAASFTAAAVAQAYVFSSHLKSHTGTRAG